MLGVDLVTEFQRSDVSEVAPRYVCDLCHSKMDVNQVIDHLEGVKHRMKYIVSTAQYGFTIAVCLLGINVTFKHQMSHRNGV